MSDVNNEFLKRGYFITLEGGEGAGKTTQIQLLAERLAAQGVESIVTREPGGNPQAELIRDLLVTGEVDRWSPMTEALLMTASRAEHVSRTIIPALSVGKWVLCDRFSDSTTAYQGLARGLGMKKMRKLQTLALEEFGPDLTFILDLPADVGLARALKRESGHGDAVPEDRFERMDQEFHQEIRTGYAKIAENEPERCRLIDADQTIEQTHAEIWEKLVLYCGINP